MATKPIYPVLTTALIDANVGLNSGFYTITPEFAAEVMTQRNLVNRKIGEAKVIQIKHDIEHGRYLTNGETIIFGSDGNLVDAQHRLTAVVETGKSIVSAVTMGVDPKSRSTVDQGRARTAGDILTMMGVVNGNAVAATAKLLIGYYDGDGTNLGRMGMTSNDEIIDYRSRHPKLDGIVTWAVAHIANCKGIVTQTQLATARFILEPIYGSIVADFLDRVAIGDNIAKDSPAFAARRRLMKEGKMTNMMALEILMRAFLAHREGRKLTSMQLQEHLPKLNKTARGINKGPLSSGTALQSGTATGAMPII